MISRSNLPPPLQVSCPLPPHIGPCLYAEFSSHREAYEPLELGVRGLLLWMQKLAEDPPGWQSIGFEKQERVWSGAEVGPDHAGGLRYPAHLPAPLATAPAFTR